MQLAKSTFDEKEQMKGGGEGGSSAEQPSEETFCCEVCLVSSHIIMLINFVSRTRPHT